MFIKERSIDRFKKKIYTFLKNDIYNLNNCNSENNGENYFIKKFFEQTDKKELIIFDIGANIGLYTKEVLKEVKKRNLHAKIHVFEPQKSLGEKLEKIYKKDIEEKIVILNNLAVSNTNDVEISLYKDKDCSTLASLCKREILACNIKMEDSEIVKTICLEKYIELNKISHIDFLKIDVEGHEYQVLEGVGRYLKDDFVDFIQFEYGGNNLDSMTPLLKIWKILEARGFIIAKIMKNGLYIEKYSVELENFQYCNYIAISKAYFEKCFKGND